MEHVAGQGEVDRALLEAKIAEVGQVQRGGHGAEHREVVEASVADLRAPLPGESLRGAVEARLGLEPAAQAAPAERGHERLRARVPEVDGNGIAGRAGEIDGDLTPERAFRELTPERRERQLAAAEADGRGERAHLDALGDAERLDGELTLAREGAADSRERRGHLDAARADERALGLACHREGAAAQRQPRHDHVESGGHRHRGRRFRPPAAPAAGGGGAGAGRETRRSKLHSPRSLRISVMAGPSRRSSAISSRRRRRGRSRGAR